MTTLIASGPRRREAWRRPLTGLTFSMAAHAVAFYAAAVATMREGTAESAVTSDRPPIYLAPQDRNSPKPPPSIRPRAFLTLVAPAIIPSSISPIDLTKMFDPRDYTGTGAELGPAQGRERSVDPNEVFKEFLVDDPPIRIAFPSPEYPGMLLEARIEGSVVLEAIIDTLGHPEPGSISVISSTNRAFEPAAISALRRALFRAGRVQGQRVRVLVRQPLKFQLPK